MMASFGVVAGEQATSIDWFAKRQYIVLLFLPSSWRIGE
jgi:hypothetical protein